MAKVARLLDQIVPHHYRISLDVDMEGFKFRAYEEVVFDLLQPSKSLIFHSVGLNVSLAELENNVRSSKVSLDPDTQVVTFEFENEVAAGEHTLNIAFTGDINESLHGFYRSSYLQAGKKKWLATTQFEAASAREALICIDEPSAKAVFELTLTIPDNLKAISNTNSVNEAPAGRGRKKIQFAPSPKMSTYLVAYLVGDFEYIEGVTPEGVDVRVYATPGQTGQLAFALDTAIRTLSFYNEYFGVAYPLPKLDMIAVPDFAAGAMENWGAVTYRETALLLDPAKTSLGNKVRVAQVIAHELAHQWFGNLVTMSWWNDLWLNEGFATWVEALALDKLFPEWNSWTQFVYEEFSRAQELDGLANTHPIEVEIDDPKALDEIFDAISYSKGASVINMLHHYLGADDFRRGLSDYLKKHSYGNTVTHNLWEALANASGKPVDEVMSKWTSSPGYPLVSYDNGKLSQQRFYSSPAEAAKSTDKTVWPIPFGVITSRNASSEPVLVESREEVLPEGVDSSEWFKPNPGQTAFYRSKYTEHMLDALSKPLEDKLLPASDRFGVVSDVLATTEAGLTDSAAAMKLLSALRREPDFIVWSSISGGLGSLVAVVEDEAIRDELLTFGRWLIGPNLERLGWKPAKGEQSFDTLMRPTILQQAVRFDNMQVVAEAKKRFTAYIEGAELDPDLRPAILFAAARHGDESDFEAMLERYRVETTPQAKMSLLGSLGRFRQPELVGRYLELGLSDDVRPQDMYMVLAYGFSNHEGRYQTWDFLKRNWELFVERYGEGGHMLERFPAYAGSGFSTHRMADEIAEFFETHPHPSITRPTAQAVEGVRLRADWYDRDKLKIRSFLSSWKATQK